MLKSLHRSSANANVPLLGCICLAFLLLLAFTLWEAFSGVQSIRTHAIRHAVSDLRAGAALNVGRIEQILSDMGTENLANLNQGNWLREAWHKAGSSPAAGLYSAIVNDEGRIVFHSNPDLEGGELGRGWYLRRLPAVGPGVVESDSEYLSGGEIAVDVTLPIHVEESPWAEYHVGLPLAAVETRIVNEQRQFLLMRGVLFSGILIVVVLAATSLYLLAERIASLRQLATSSVVEQANQISRLAAGLAHEIRNPLHALRLNLHTFRRAQFDNSLLEESEVMSMLEESSREISRIENLMNELASFATSEQPRNETIDLPSEVESIVEFLRQEMLRQNVEVEVHNPGASISVVVDPGRLRQILLNLIQNAVDAMPGGGKIYVSIASRRGRAFLLVADNGPGIPEADRERIFEPFFTQKSDGTGLGLALVRRFVKEAGGTIRCQPSESGGASFSLAFPEARPKGKS